MQGQWHRIVPRKGSFGLEKDGVQTRKKCWPLALQSVTVWHSDPASRRDVIPRLSLRTAIIFSLRIRITSMNAKPFVIESHYLSHPRERFLEPPVAVVECWPFPPYGSIRYLAHRAAVPDLHTLHGSLELLNVLWSPPKLERQAAQQYCQTGTDHGNARDRRGHLRTAARAPSEGYYRAVAPGSVSSFA